MFTANQIVAHLVGDYILQSHWMATEKTSRSIAALAHCLCYTLPFLFLTQDPLVLGIIAGSHFVIDRWRLARYVIWLKNWIAPINLSLGRGHRHPNPPWIDCSKTGYPDDTPPWLSVWLLIFTDNTLHILCNGLAIAWGAAH